MSPKKEKPGETFAPAQFYFVSVEGRPRRVEQFSTRAAAEVLAKQVAMYDEGRKVLVYVANPVVDEGAPQ
jgi:hypothetical protein